MLAASIHAARIFGEKCALAGTRACAGRLPASALPDRMAAYSKRGRELHNPGPLASAVQTGQQGPKLWQQEGRLDGTSIFGV